MAVVRSSKLNLPNPSLSPSSPRISSLLFEPFSSSLALTLSDSSISLYPSTFPFSSPSLSYPQTLIASPCSSASFLILRSRNHSCNDNSVGESSPRVLFVVAGPHRGGSHVLLRFYVLREGNKRFARAHVLCDQKGIEFDRKFGVLLSLSHGISVKVNGSVNYFTMYSASSSKIFVYGVKLANDGNGGDEAVMLKLVRCAVIGCSRPVWSIGIFSALLLLGEENGVRVLSFKDLVKGKKVKNNAKSEGKRLRAANNNTGNGYLEGKTEKHAVHVMQKLGKHEQESTEASMCFVPFRNEAADADLRSKSCPVMFTKAISIQALSPKRFLILDSAGYIHVLHVSGTPIGSNFACHIGKLPHFMEVQKLAIGSEISVGTVKFWISDGDYSVHTVTLCDEDTAVKEEAEDKSDKTPMHVSVKQAIFAPEKIQDMVPLGGDGILILGQGQHSLHTWGSDIISGRYSFKFFQRNVVMNCCCLTTQCLEVHWHRRITWLMEKIATHWWLVSCGQHFNQPVSCSAASMSCTQVDLRFVVQSILNSR